MGGCLREEPLLGGAVVGYHYVFVGLATLATRTVPGSRCWEDASPYSGAPLEPSPSCWLYVCVCVSAYWVPACAFVRTIRNLKRMLKSLGLSWRRPVLCWGSVFMGCGLPW